MTFCIVQDMEFQCSDSGFKNFSGGGHTPVTSWKAAHIWLALCGPPHFWRRSDAPDDIYVHHASKWIWTSLVLMVRSFAIDQSGTQAGVNARSGALCFKIPKNFFAKPTQFKTRLREALSSSTQLYNYEHKNFYIIILFTKVNIMKILM